MKGSKFANIVSKNNRYRMRVNPLYIAYPSIVNESLFKSAIALSERQDVLGIIDSELSQDFTIGGHSDYNYLLDQVTEKTGFEGIYEEDVPLCIVYIDLRNFSKRALFVDDPGYETIVEIANLKQKAISTWIKVALYYQAHIHSITGDGLMILIGGKQEYDNDNWCNGARALLLGLRVLESEKILNDELKDYFQQKGLEKYAVSDNLLDIKVSIDYSPKTLMNPQGVLVNNNGFKKPVGEVKATAFQIDACAKILSYYPDIKSRLEGFPKVGRALLFGNEYKNLMDFNKEKINIFNAGCYSRTMFGITNSYNSFYIDAKDYKENIITIEDVAGICNVFDDSTTEKYASINIAREASVQHG